MIEFPAVIQEVLVRTSATTLVLDIAADDIAGLADLIDQEVVVTIAPALPIRTVTPAPPASSPEKPRRTSVPKSPHE